MHPSPVLLAGTPSRGSLREPAQADGDRQVLPFSTITNPSQVLSFSMSVYRRTLSEPSQFSHVGRDVVAISDHGCKRQSSFSNDCPRTRITTTEQSASDLLAGSSTHC